MAEVTQEAPVVEAVAPVSKVVASEKLYSVPQSVIDLFIKAASKLELTLAKEELLKHTG